MAQPFCRFSVPSRERIVEEYPISLHIGWAANGFGPASVNGAMNFTELSQQTVYRHSITGSFSAGNVRSNRGHGREFGRAL